jgi:hypothetical protein
LGGELSAITNQLNEVWYQNTLPQWQERHQYVVEAERGIIELEAKAQDNGLNADEILKLACWKGEFREIGDGIELLRVGLQSHDDRSDFHYYLAMMLVADGRDISAALTHFDRAMELELRFIPGSCETIYEIASQSEDSTLKKRCEEIIDRHVRSFDAAYEERTNISHKDLIIPHDLSAAEVKQIHALFIDVREIKKIYMVRKESDKFNENSWYFFVIVYEYPMYKFVTNEVISELSQKINDRLESIPFNIDFTGKIVRADVPENDEAKLLNRLKKMKESIVFSR